MLCIQNLLGFYYFFNYYIKYNNDYTETKIHNRMLGGPSKNKNVYGK